MKSNKCIAILMVTLLMFSVMGSVVFATGDDALANVGFELGTKDGWTTADTATVESTGAKEGSYYLSVPAGVYRTYTPKLPVEAGKKYIVRFYFKQNLDACIYANSYGEGVAIDKGALLNIGVEGMPKTGEDWKLFEVKTGVIQDGVSAVSVSFRTIGGDLKIDGFSIREDNGVYPEEMINGGFEDGIADYQATGTVAEETTKKHGGSKAIKLTNAASVSKTVDIAAGTNYYVTAYFYLESLVTEGVEEGTDVGAKLSVLNGGATIYQTEFFKALDTEDKWRKMMICIPSTNTVEEITLKAELAGEGVVYFDDISVIGTDDLILNGDFEGLTSDTKPAGTFSALSASASLSSDTDKGTCLLVTKFAEPVTSSRIPYKSASTIYRLTMDFKSSNSSNPWINIYELDASSSTGNLDGVNEDVWKTFEFYFNVTGIYSYSNMIGLYSRGGGKVYFDNIKLEEVCQKDDLNQDFSLTLQKGDNDVETLYYGDTVVAKYSEMNQNYASAGRKVTMVLALYKISGGKMTLSDIKVEGGQAPAQTNLSYNNWEERPNYKPVGKAPLEMTAQITVPQNDGNRYCVKAFVLDGTNFLTHLADAKTLG